MTSITVFLKRIISYSARLRYRLCKRLLSDVCDLSIFYFAKPIKKDIFIQKKTFLKIENTLEIIQPILYTPQSAAKIVNIKIAAVHLNTTIIAPNQIFSFWHIVGKPTAAKGYAKGRNIIDGKLVEDVGGGLCQLASIIYHAAITAGLQITERYNHSMDIYTKDSERFTPLGADATVVFGFKDFRFRNTFDFPIAFEIKIIEDTLVCKLRASAQIKPKTLTFNITHIESKGRKMVETRAENAVIATSFYK